jgi:hypothetical protein
MMNQQPESLEHLVKRVQRLEDLEAIKRLITFYGRGSDDHHNIAVMGPLFADDAVLDVGSGYGQYQGRKAIEAFLSGPGEKIILWSIHYMISPTIDIAEDGRTAKGFWYLWEVAKMRNPRKDGEEAVWIGGSYDGEFVKLDDGQWKFKYVKLNMEIMSPYSEGWAKKPFHDFGVPE